MLINQLDSTHINSLTDLQLTELLHRLIRLEAEKYSMNYSFFVPDKITRADGGEDGGITCDNPNGSNWINEKNIIFQNKAKNLTPKECEKEILSIPLIGKNKVKKQIEKVLDSGGKYILFMRYHPGSKADLDTRIDAFYNATKKVKKKYKKEQFDVYDGKKIADWANNFIETIILVQEFNGITRISGLLTIDKWGEYESIKTNPFFSNDSINGIIEGIKKELNNKNVTIRIVGHSGLGKTRLVYESLHKLENAFGSIVYYCVETNQNDIIEFIRTNNGSLSGILVIDNCDYDLHNKLKKEVSRGDSNFKLITIDYDVDEMFDKTRQINQTYFYLKSELYKDVVIKILENAFSGRLKKNEIEEIAAYSDGYPIMAVYFAQARLDGNESLSELLHTDIKERLVFGRDYTKKEEFQEQYNLIQACSVFTEFGYPFPEIETLFGKEIFERAKEQAKFIFGSVCNQPIHESKFVDYCNYFYKRGILERRGNSYLVRPNPLAIKLAMEWWKSFLDVNSKLKELLPKIETLGLSISFVERFKHLDQLNEAKKIANDFWGEKSPFGSAEVLNTEMGSRLFRSVVDVNPEATVKSLRLLTENKSIEDIRAISIGRRNLVWAIEKLLYREESFNDAAKTLYDFATGENENIGNNSTNQFLQIFHIFLPGTVANFNSRIEIIKYGLSKKSVEYNRIAILALGSSLKAENFHRMGGAEKQGANLIFVDYQPNDWQEIFEYWKFAMETLTEFALNDTELKELAMEQIANSIRTMFSHNQIELISETIRKVYTTNKIYWEGAIRGLNWTLKYAKLHDERNNIVKELLNFITPNDIENQFKMFVSKPEWEHEKDEKGDYIDVSANKVAEFVTDLHSKGVEIKDYFKLIVEGEQRQGFNFGVNLSKVYGNQLELGKSLIGELKKIKKESQNSDALGGLIYDSAVEIKCALLNEVLQDPLIYFHAFYLMRVSNPTKEDIFKLFPIVSKEPTYIVYFNNFIYGRALDNLSTEDVIDFCNEIAKYDLQGKWVSIAIISQYCYNNQEFWNKCKSFIKQLIISDNFLNGIDKVRTMDEYHWSNSIIKLLKEEKDEQFAKEISKQILEAFAGVRVSSVDVYLKNLCLELITEYFEIFWNVISTGILGAAYLNIKFTLGSHNGSWGDRGLLFKGNNDLIFEWCKLNRPKGALRIAYMMPIYENQEGKSLWHPFALKMINEFGSDEGFLRELSANMGSFSSVGSSIEYYEMQIELIKKLVNHGNLTVREWAKEKLNGLDRTIQREKIDEDSRS